MGKAIYENYLKEKRRYLAFLVLVIGLGVAISGLSPYVFGEVIDIFSLMYLVNFAFQSRVRRLEAQQKKVEDRYYSFVGSMRKNRDSS